jgi:hypothetical protein
MRTLMRRENAAVGVSAIGIGRYPSGALVVEAEIDGGDQGVEPLGGLRQVEVTATPDQPAPHPVEAKVFLDDIGNDGEAVAMTNEQIDALRDETFMRIRRALAALDAVLKRDFDQVYVEKAKRKADETFAGKVVPLRRKK